MKKQLITIAISSTLLATSVQNVYAKDDDTSSSGNTHYIGAGIGAITGALLAGPVGFIAGGVLGSQAGKRETAVSNDIAESLTENEMPVLSVAQTNTNMQEQDEPEQSLVVAQSAELESVIENDTTETSSVIEQLLMTDINFDVFFLSGSTAVEAYYKPRIQAIARLMQQLPETGIHLEGYSDRRGDQDENLALAQQRLDAVRNALELAGVAPDRIRLSAFGEQGFVSSPGKLEAYTFDRRVVIHFEHTPARTDTPVALMEATPAQ